ncbi:thioredoxin family protein [Thiohalophilus sp.]|uniref:thioredoxin family protein n=1 Tax=Thiohalophilus sp. TaxID=3028392 RepID=UPI00397679BF
MNDTQTAIFDVDLEQFDHKVLAASHERPVLVDLWAEWCPPCISIAPLLKQVIDDYAGRILLAKVEVDEGENMKLAGRYQVRGFPTIILFRNGEEQARFSGARTVGYICDFIEQHAGF